MNKGILYAEIAIGGVKENGTIQDSAFLHLFVTHVQSTHFTPYADGPRLIKEDIDCRC